MSHANHQYRLIVQTSTLLAVLPFASTYADTLYVPADYETIQSAVDHAFDGDEIIVAPGTYTGNLQYIVDIQECRSVTLRSSGGPEVTFIDGGGTGGGITYTCEENEANLFVIEGFTIQNGFAEQGGGLSISGGSVTVRNCIFLENTVEPGPHDNGGAIYSYNGALELENCLFRRNIAGWVDVEPYGIGAEDFGDGRGGGIYIESKKASSLSNCTFEGNMATEGGGIYNDTDFTDYDTVALAISGCTFRANRAIPSAQTSGSGGAIYNRIEAGLVEVTNSLFDDNTSAKEGGGVWSRTSWLSGIVVSDCTFTNNSVETTHDVTAEGGAIRIMTEAPSCAEDGILLHSDFLPNETVLVRIGYPTENYFYIDEDLHDIWEGRFQISRLPRNKSLPEFSNADLNNITTSVHNPYVVETDITNAVAVIPFHHEPRDNDSSVNWEFSCHDLTSSPCVDDNGDGVLDCLEVTRGDEPGMWLELTVPRDFETGSDLLAIEYCTTWAEGNFSAMENLFIALYKKSGVGKKATYELITYKGQNNSQPPCTPSNASEPNGLNFALGSLFSNDQKII